jgi:DNA mismatch endonuclease, patch repair protein
MADIVDRSTRSRMMSGIRGKNTKPEVLVRKYLHRHGLRFRLHVQRLPGKPDLLLPKFRAVVNVHGCFWHQHPGCRYAYMPASNRGFWREKLQGNAKRDSRNSAALVALGWRVFTVWECETRDQGRLSQLAKEIRASGSAGVYTLQAAVQDV